MYKPVHGQRCADALGNVFCAHFLLPSSFARFCYWVHAIAFAYSLRPYISYVIILKLDMYICM